jgi:hypothetical protein
MPSFFFFFFFFWRSEKLGLDGGALAGIWRATFANRIQKVEFGIECEPRVLTRFIVFVVRFLNDFVSESIIIVIISFAVFFVNHGQSDCPEMLIAHGRFVLFFSTMGNPSNPSRVGVRDSCHFTSKVNSPLAPFLLKNCDFPNVWHSMFF